MGASKGSERNESVGACKGWRIKKGGNAKGRRYQRGLSYAHAFVGAP